MPALLIAGPLALDDHPQQAGLLGGVGGYAAMAAAPLNPTQLWARGGSDFTPQLKGILERRGIDLAGVAWDGPTPRGTAGGFVPGGTLLPDIEPTDAEDVGAVLLIGLPPVEMNRALAVVQALPDAATRPVLVSPRPDDLKDPAYRQLLGRTTDVLILSVAKAREITGTPGSIEAAEALRADGWKAVILTAGALGGLLLYGQKSTTYPALPLPTVDKLGVSAAFPGAVAAWVAGVGAADYATLKRACAVASGVGGLTAQGIGPRRLLAANHDEILERFNRLRREHKY
jgi:sugar/nucleoside kinase (ribokinase family)